MYVIMLAKLHWLVIQCQMQQVLIIPVPSISGPLLFFPYLVDGSLL